MRLSTSNFQKYWNLRTLGVWASAVQNLVILLTPPSEGCDISTILSLMKPCSPTTALWQVAAKCYVKCLAMMVSLTFVPVADGSGGDAATAIRLRRRGFGGGGRCTAGGQGSWSCRPRLCSAAQAVMMAVDRSGWCWSRMSRHGKRRFHTPNALSMLFLVLIWALLYLDSQILTVPSEAS